MDVVLILNSGIIFFWRVYRQFRPKKDMTLTSRIHGSVCVFVSVCVWGGEGREGGRIARRVYMCVAMSVYMCIKVCRLGRQ